MAIRAMAHPVRLDLRALLAQEGPLTAADAARRLGISQALASHHLRQMAKYDFVERATGKDNRERPWRLVSTSQSWRDAVKTPEGAAAADILEQLLAERALEALTQWQERRVREDPIWRDNSGIGQSGFYLTGDELAELVTQIDALLQRYVDDRPIDDKSKRPPGSRHVSITQILTITPEAASAPEREQRQDQR